MLSSEIESIYPTLRPVDPIVATEKELPTFDKRAATRTALGYIGIELDEQNEVDVKLLDFFQDRIINSGMDTQLPGFQDDTETLPGLPVLSSGMAKQLLNADWQMVGMFDAKSLFYANRVDQKNGDRLLRKATQHILEKYPEFALVRWGGDEFVLMGKNDSRTQEEIQKFNATLLTENEGKEPVVETDKKVYFNFKGEKLDTVRLALKRATPSLVRNQYERNSDVSLDIRTKDLSAFHTELSFLSNEPNIENIPFIEKKVSILESILYDPVLEETATEINKLEKVNKPDGPTRVLSVYIDQLDFVHHLQNGINSYDFYRFEIPGVAKITNDSKGHEAGNALLVDMLKNVYAGLKNRGAESVKILRRGPDLFIAVPKNDALEKYDASNFDPVRKITSVDKKKENQLGVPTPEDFDVAVIPAIASVDITVGLDEKKNTETFNKTMKLLGPEVKNDFNAKLRERLSNIDSALEEFLKRYYSPAKRGDVRWNDLGLKWEQLAPFYDEEHKFAFKGDIKKLASILKNRLDEM